MALSSQGHDVVIVLQGGCRKHQAYDVNVAPANVTFHTRRKRGRLPSWIKYLYVHILPIDIDREICIYTHHVYIALYICRYMYVCYIYIYTCIYSWMRTMTLLGPK